MESKPVNVDGLRRLLNVSPEELPDAEIRRALAILAADYNPADTPEEVAAQARRFAEFMSRLGPI